MEEKIHRSVFTTSEQLEMHVKEQEYIAEARKGNGTRLRKFWDDKRALLIIRGNELYNDILDHNNEQVRNKSAKLA